ncbi:hypothetical protein [uncultured Empedobacter sp.]|uniref:hypothetical protein n=1 Tax=uncultured Empedobacter sp. TaxID=410844 RepID=UPI0025CC31D1|nr:hypothetical protein [uncultured Empedobacter sp.]
MKNKNSEIDKIIEKIKEKTQKDELIAIGVILNKNITSTAIELHKISYDFTKQLNHQPKEVDEKIYNLIKDKLKNKNEIR